MKIKRYKKVNRHLNFYNNNFGFRHPYQLLVDGTFCYAALKNQVNIADNLSRYLQADLKLLTTQCAIIEAESLGPKVFGALQILKQYAIHKCGHEGKPILGADCFLSMVGKTNDKHYIIATQDRDLQKKLKDIAAAPVLYLHQKAPVLEKPSEASVQFAQSKRSCLSEWEKTAVEVLKKESGICEEETKRPKKKKKKGANPLSCKKKKKKSGAVQCGVSKKDGESVRVKRKKVRIPKHVKEELVKLSKASD